METLFLGAVVVLFLVIALFPSIKRTLLGWLGAGESFEPKDPPPPP